MNVRELVVSHNSAYNEILGRTTMYKVGAIMTTSILTRKFITDDGEVEALREDKSEAERCHIATLHDSKNQLPKLAKPKTAGRVHLADLEPPGRKITEKAQPVRELEKV
ncbi:hypothetical protein PIB30_010266 [Stylosanthes scabra]|uniref:Uncharacterized protein n=1 Tax=Stylosanthes scabra TaxID=79078 RepID=A0ABU6T5Y5_9FABA|nr:hypothetical protein [Stylosanthes scabra]